MLSTWLLTRRAQRAERHAAARIAAEKKRADTAEVALAAAQAEVERLRAQNRH